MYMYVHVYKNAVVHPSLFLSRAVISGSYSCGNAHIIIDIAHSLNCCRKISWEGS